MKIKLTEYKNIETHLLERLNNHPWIEATLAGDAKKFPYRIAEKGKAVLDQMDYVANNPSKLLPVGTDGKTRYLVNIPCTSRMIKKVPNYFTFLEKLFIEQSAHSISASNSFAKESLSVVVGVNQPKSIDPSKNRELATIFDTLPKAQELPFNVFVFFWIPQWEVSNYGIKHLYPKERAYLLIKALSTPESTVALRILGNTEGETSLSPDLVNQIPFQQIRNRIKESVVTKRFLQHYERTSPNSRIYYGVMNLSE